MFQVPAVSGDLYRWSVRPYAATGRHSVLRI